jgi:hypothetical protein
MLIHSPEALERQVHRIHELLEDSNAEVTWNDHVRDPDNPSQSRQIDVTIRSRGRLTIVECRLSRARQNVKWIEELMGRRQSLGADTVIAVAAAGFTLGAQRKAARYGVLLRDLYQLTEDEITTWGRQVALTLYYYQYSELRLSIGFAADSISSVDTEVLSSLIHAHPILQSVFGTAAHQLDTLNLFAREDYRTVSFGILLRANALELGGRPVVEIGLEGKARLVARPITSRAVFGYGKPGLSAPKRDVIVEQFALGETSIAHQGDQTAVEVDLSAFLLPPFSQFRYVRMAGSEESENAGFGLICPEKLQVTGEILNFRTYAIGT